MAMDLPFVVALTEQASANGTITLSYQVPSNQEFHISDYGFVADGAFSLTGIRDSEGNRYTSASNNNPLLSTMLKNTANQNNTVDLFPIPLQLKGSRTIYFDFLDTSGSANDIWLALIGKRLVNV